MSLVEMCTHICLKNVMYSLWLWIGIWNGGMYVVWIGGMEWGHVCSIYGLGYGMGTCMQYGLGHGVLWNGDMYVV